MSSTALTRNDAWRTPLHTRVSLSARLLHTCRRRVVRSKKPVRCSFLAARRPCSAEPAFLDAIVELPCDTYRAIAATDPFTSSVPLIERLMRPRKARQLWWYATDEYTLVDPKRKQMRERFRSNSVAFPSSGDVILREYTHNGALELAMGNGGAVQSVHFANDAFTGAILWMPYLRHMLSAAGALTDRKTPWRVLNLGLGSGCLAGYVAENCADHVISVEIDAAVVAAAQTGGLRCVVMDNAEDAFAANARRDEDDSKRACVVVADANAVVTGTKSPGNFDVIFFDCFDGSGDVATLATESFLLQLLNERWLAPGGCVICNTPNGMKGSPERHAYLGFGAAMVRACKASKSDFTPLTFAIPMQPQNNVLVAAPGRPNEWSLSRVQANAGSFADRSLPRGASHVDAASCVTDAYALDVDDVKGELVESLLL
ncbi:calmodulin-lysine N-methyltransferase [Pseudoscourfieldia marina]